MLRVGVIRRERLAELLEVPDVVRILISGRLGEVEAAVGRENLDRSDVEWGRRGAPSSSLPHEAGMQTA